MNIKVSGKRKASEPFSPLTRIFITDAEEVKEAMEGGWNRDPLVALAIARAGLARAEEDMRAAVTVVRPDVAA